jgi:hypothetical protein
MFTRNLGEGLMLTDDQIISQFEAAFAPLECRAKIHDYGQKLKFKVYDNAGNGIHEEKGIVLRDIRDHINLQVALENRRDLLKIKKSLDRLIASGIAYP